MAMGYPFGQQVSHDYDASPMSPVSILTTDQIERLAKAGVTIELANKVVVQDPPSAPAPPAPRYSNDISQGIRERYFQSLRAKETLADADTYRFAPQPTLCAFQHGDKVYVFAYGGNAAPEIIEDEACIYPSDALLARIHLMMQHAK